MPDRAEGDEIRAAGAVVWRLAAGQPQVVLVHRPKYDDWSFPKGKAEPGEQILLTAVREVEEETGLQVTLGRNLPTVRYHAVAGPKRVDYWAARADGQDRGAFTATREVDQLGWLTEPEAAARLSYDHDVKLLGELFAGPLDTVPLILLRHAAAGDRSDWEQDDTARPLDAEGERQAVALAALLRCFGAARLRSSPAERCLATVRPFAAETGVPVDADPDLAVLGTGGTVRDRHDGAAARAVSRALASPEPTVLCAHRENVPLLLEAACDQLSAPVPAGPPLRKGEFWVLHVAAGTLAAAERHHADGGDLTSLRRNSRMAQKGVGTRPAAPSGGSAGRLGRQAVHGRAQ
jgi:8-oxo-(d)GTP phosphatase